VEDSILSLLSTMDIPSKRKEDMSEGNIRWLLRNLFIHNGNHPDFDRVLDMLVDYAWWKGWTNNMPVYRF
jgi:hypothetical protein